MLNKATANKQVKAVQANVNTILNNAKDYSRNLYLAGLGVANTTEQQRTKAYKEVVKTSKEVVKTGTVIFNDLVKAGEGLEKKGKKLVGEQTKVVSSQLNNVKNTVEKKIDALKVQSKKVTGTPVKSADKKATTGVAAKAPVKALAKTPVKKPVVKATAPVNAAVVSKPALV